MQTLRYEHEIRLQDACVFVLTDISASHCYSVATVINLDVSKMCHVWGLNVGNWSLKILEKSVAAAVTVFIQCRGAASSLRCSTCFCPRRKGRQTAKKKQLVCSPRRHTNVQFPSEETEV